MASPFANFEEFYAPNATDVLAFVFIFLWLVLVLFQLISVATGWVLLASLFTELRYSILSCSLDSFACTQTMFVAILLICHYIHILEKYTSTNTLSFPIIKNFQGFQSWRWVIVHNRPYCPHVILNVVWWSVEFLACCTCFGVGDLKHFSYQWFVYLYFAALGRRWAKSYKKPSNFFRTQIPQGKIHK